MRMFFGYENIFEPIGSRPLLIMGVLCIIMGALFISTGLLAEMIIHISETAQSPKEQSIIKKEF